MVSAARENNENVLTIKDVARIYKTSEKSIYRSYRGWPHFKIGGQLRFYHDELERHFRNARATRQPAASRKVIVDDSVLSRGRNR